MSRHRNHRSAAIARVGAVGALLACAGVAGAQVEPHAGMLRYPDVSATHIVFSYAGDLWLVPREGGDATPLANPAGVETNPRFSPDGASIAFIGNYDGDRDIYTIAAAGGVPFRVTHHPMTEILTDWTADDRLLYFGSGVNGLGRQTSIMTVSPEGGIFDVLPVPYGANGAISDDGKWLAYTPHSRDTRTWKRYRGGMATDIWLFNLETYESEQITDFEGTDSLPMWHGDTVYYLSDAGDEHRLNLWSYSTKSGERKQLTRFADFDCKWPAMGPGPRGGGEIVFQNGASLYLLDLRAGQTTEVRVTVPGARAAIKDQLIDVRDQVSWGSLSPSAKRVAVEARGDVWSNPAENGTPRNMTRTSGVAERTPAWSPDGRWIAYFSDETGEYELYVTQSDGKGETKQLTSGSKTYYNAPSWSPDGKHILFTDKAGRWLMQPAEGGDLVEVDRDPWGDAGAASWSHDSRWIAYAKSGDAGIPSIWIYEVETGEKQQVTSDLFADSSPTFDRVGDWLYFVSSRNQSPLYSDIAGVEQSFIYANGDVLLAVPLRDDIASPYAPESDEESWSDDASGDDEAADEAGDDDAGEADEAAATPDAAPDDGVSGVWEGTLTGGEPLPPGGAPFTMNIVVAADGSVTGSFSVAVGSGSVSGTYDKNTGVMDLTISVAGGPTVSCRAQITGQSMTATLSAPDVGFSGEMTGSRTSAGGSSGGDDAGSSGPGKARETVEIDFDGFERRAIQLPIKPGNFGGLSVNSSGHLLFVRMGVRGGSDAPSINLFDMQDDKKEEKTVAGGAASYELTADGKKMLVMRGSAMTIQNPSAGDAGKPVVTAGMMTNLDPREEWEQVFTEAWRLQRDFFYDPGLHGVDWDRMYVHYKAMLDDCATRDDVGFVISELISELNVGHTYYRAGDTVESGPSVSVGMLGCDFELVSTDAGTAFRIAKIYEGGPWDSDARGPLSQPGVDVKEGDFLLAVNGAPVDTSRDPWAAFLGLANRPVTLTVSEKAVMDDDARDVVVEPLTSDGNLRYRAWIEENRAYVEYKSGGRVGYIYVPDTGVNGQNNLVRQFYGQRGKDALIIDERWNGGGQIPTRFIELLNRPVTNYWARRDGKDWQWPPDSHQGHKVMLINGLAGSGGDAFPYYFRQAGLGKLVGMRTWGGLVGISGNPGLIDGAGVTVPTFGFYENDGTWGIEGHGVDPDIRVVDDPALMVDGGDPQLDAAIDLMMEAIRTSPVETPARPEGPNRGGMGIPDRER
jgi:tricorn protease